MKILPQSIAILGRQSDIATAELESILGSEVVLEATKQVALLSVDAHSIPTHLGSTIKLCAMITRFDTMNWQDIENQLVSIAVEHEPSVPDGKLTIGVSAIGFTLSTKDLGKTSLKIKKAVRISGRSVRLVPNTALLMNSAQVLHNHLTGPRGLELVVVRVGDTALVGRTVWEQPIEEYAARDQTRPMRDARVGMLPPKLAQTILNLAVGTNNSEKDSDTIVLDPFCGTGVIIQEGLLMGHVMVGSDIEQRMIDYTTRNIEWLDEKFTVGGTLRELQLGDAMHLAWNNSSEITHVASETFLGKPFGNNALPMEIEKERHEVQALLRLTLKNLHRQLPSGTRLCLAVPAWKVGPNTKTLPLIDQLPEMGYNLVSFRHVDARRLIYRRDDQVVGRQLVVMVKE